MEKELACLRGKWEKKKELEKMINSAISEIETCEQKQLLFSDGENSMREWEKQIQRLMLLNEISTPSSQFIFFRYKDSLKIDDFGGIQEASYKLPVMTKNTEEESKKLFIFGDDSYSKTILKYDIQKDEWDVDWFKDGCSEKFFNCSASIALDSDRLMITGGGSPP